MRIPRFSAEVSLYSANAYHQGLATIPPDSSGAQMAKSCVNRLSAASIIPSASFAPLTCYIDGIETPCDIALGCYFAGYCDPVPSPFAVTTKTRTGQG
jgi:hypothetical protein